MTSTKPKKSRKTALKITLENGTSRIIEATKGWHLMGLLMKHRIPVGAVKEIEFVEPA